MPKNVAPSGEAEPLEIPSEFKADPTPILEVQLIKSLSERRIQEGQSLKLAAIRFSKQAWVMAGHEKLRKQLLVASLMGSELSDYVAKKPTDLCRIEVLQDAFSSVSEQQWSKMTQHGELRLLRFAMNFFIILRNSEILATNPHKVKAGALVERIADKLPPDLWFKPLEINEKNQVLCLLLMEIIDRDVNTGLNAVARDVFKNLTPTAPCSLLTELLNLLTSLLKDYKYINPQCREEIDTLAQVVAERVSKEAWINLSQQQSLSAMQLIRGAKEYNEIKQCIDEKGLICFLENTLWHLPKDILVELSEERTLAGSFGKRFNAIVSERLEPSCFACLKKISFFNNMQKHAEPSIPLLKTVSQLSK